MAMVLRWRSVGAALPTASVFSLLWPQWLISIVHVCMNHRSGVHVLPPVPCSPSGSLHGAGMHAALPRLSAPHGAAVNLFRPTTRLRIYFTCTARPPCPQPFQRLALAFLTSQYMARWYSMSLLMLPPQYLVETIPWPAV